MTTECKGNNWSKAQHHIFCCWKNRLEQLAKSELSDNWSVVIKKKNREWLFLKRDYKGEKKGKITQEWEEERNKVRKRERKGEMFFF